MADQDPSSPFIGRTLAGRFRITGYIGEGGMAAVYRGVQDGDGRNVAIKVMNADLVKDRKFVRRFRREAKAASMLKHPNTVEIIEFGVDEETVYLAMECIEGLDLAMVLERDRRIPEARAANIVMQVCAALSVAHAQTIIHRDLKPDNIMVMPHPKEKGAELVKVLDFGIAKILDEDEGPMPDPRAEPQSHAPSLLTRVGTIVGTPAYMSPEQGRAEKVDARTDIYACGVLLYELVTGRTPFGGETPMQVVMRHVNEPPMPPSQWVETHPELEKIILKALKKWPAERQQSADEMARALKTVLPDLATTKRALAGQGGPSASVQIDQAPPTAAVPLARPAAGAPPPAAGAPGTAPRAAAGAPPPADDGDDEPSTLMIPDTNAMMQAAPKGAPAAAAADKKLVFPTLNIDLPEDLEKAGMPRGSAKSPTMASQSAAAPAATPAAPSIAAISAAPPSDEDDDARTLIAHPSPSRGQTGPGPRVEAAPGGGLALAQTLASEIKEPDARPTGPSPAAGKPASPADDGPEITVGPVGDRASAPAAAPAAKPAAASPAAGKDGAAAPHGLAATLPIGQAEVERAMQAAAAAAPPARAALGSMSEASSPGQNHSNPGVGLSAMSSSGGHPIAPPSQAVVPAAKSGISVATAMVLGALIGALVVGGIVVALVSMR
jgi:serine/threonine protein kinase